MSPEIVAHSRMPTPWGCFDVHVFEDGQGDDRKEHLALSMGDLRTGEPVLTRVHSECLTGDALFSLRCDCGAQLQTALERIAAGGRGLLIYLRQEGRGIGLANKIRAYALQDRGADTVEANRKLGFEADPRDYTPCRDILDHFGVARLQLMTNNPGKVDSLVAMGFEVVERLPLEVGSNIHNRDYLSTKAGKLGHFMESPR